MHYLINVFSKLSNIINLNQSLALNRRIFHVVNFITAVSSYNMFQVSARSSFLQNKLNFKGVLQNPTPMDMFKANKQQLASELCVICAKRLACAVR